MHMQCCPLAADIKENTAITNSGKNTMDERFLNIKFFELFIQSEIGKYINMYHGCVLCINYVGQNQRKGPFERTRFLSKNIYNII